MEKKFWTSDKLLSLAALLVSIGTLSMFTYQVTLIRKQQYMSVYPHLALTNAKSGSLDYQFLLINQGIGPALVKEFRVTHDNGEEYGSLVPYLEDYLTEEDSIYPYNSDIFPGRLIPAEEQIPLMGLIDAEKLSQYGLPPNTLEGAWKLNQLLNSDSLHIEIVYESIYGERWIIRNGEYVPEKIEE